MTYLEPLMRRNFLEYASYVVVDRAIPDIRADRVAELKAQIASGAYETDAKLNVALDRLLDEMA